MKPPFSRNFSSSREDANLSHYRNFYGPLRDYNASITLSSFDSHSGGKQGKSTEMQPFFSKVLEYYLAHTRRRKR